MTRPVLRVATLGAASVACLATSSAEAPSASASDTLDQTVYVAGAGHIDWTAWAPASTVDFHDADVLVVDATTAGIGGTLTLTITANGLVSTDTIALSGGNDTTATVRLDGILPGCTPTAQGCRTDIALDFTTNIPVDVDLRGVLTVTGNDPGPGLSVDLASGT